MTTAHKSQQLHDQHAAGKVLGSTKIKSAKIPKDTNQSIRPINEKPKNNRNELWTPVSGDNEKHQKRTEKHQRGTLENRNEKQNT